MSAPARGIAARSSVFLIALLLLTAALLLLWGHSRPLDQDEVFVLQTDSVASLRQLVDVQRHTPISLDPLFFHALGHASTRIFGADAFAIRLPSLLGYLLMQVCLYLSGTLLGGATVGLVAAAVPAVTATLFYGMQARPYGVLLGLAALLLLSWQQATRAVDGPVRQPRGGSLLLLALSLGLALNTHYFAILLLLPLYGAELVRTAVRRRAQSRISPDWPVILALAAGTAAVTLTLPFQHAAGEFRTHYYNAGQVGWHAVTQSYRALIINYTDYPLPLQRILSVVLVLAALLLLYLLLRRSTGAATTPKAEQTFLLLLAALPICGFLLARLVTHSIEVRYVLPAILGIALMVALAAAQYLRPAAWIVLLLLIAFAGAERLREQRIKTLALQQQLLVTPELRSLLLTAPGRQIFVQNLGYFDESTPLLPDDVRSRMVLLYSREQELHWLQHDTGALTVEHMRHFTFVPSARYEALARGGEAQWMLLRPDGWEWLGSALRNDGATVTPLLHTLGAELVEVRFPASRTQGRLP